MDAIYDLPPAERDGLPRFRSAFSAWTFSLTFLLLIGPILSAEAGKPVWRHVGVVRLHMRDASDAYLRDYVDRTWEEIRHCVGAYQIEAEGVRLFHRIEGDYFNILGLPLLELLSYLTLRGTLPA